MRSIEMKVVDIESLKESDSFKGLFTIAKKVSEAIYLDIGKNGYDASHPIHVWKGKIIDGYTRWQAAKKAKLKEVPICVHGFEDENEALLYAIHCQAARRNLSDEEIVNCILTMDKIKKTGRKKGLSNKPSGLQNQLAPYGAQKIGKPLNLLDKVKSKKSLETEESEKSAKETAAALNISPRKVERTRTVIKKASPEVLDAVKQGDISVNEAYNKTMGKEKLSTPLEEQGWIQWMPKAGGAIKDVSVDSMMERILVSLSKGIFGFIFLGTQGEHSEFNPTWEWIHEQVQLGKTSGCIVFNQKRQMVENQEESIEVRKYKEG